MDSKKMSVMPPFISFEDSPTNNIGPKHNILIPKQEFLNNKQD